MGEKKGKTKTDHREKIHNKRILEIIEEYISLTHASKKEVYGKLGIAQGNISLIESGGRGFTVDQVAAAGRFFGVTTDWIVGNSDTRTIVTVPVPSAMDALIESKVEQLLRNRR